jgi:putative membrane protein
MNGGMLGLAVIGQLLLWVGVVTTIVLLVHALCRPDRDPGTAEEILARRFARGEITDEEYRRRLTQLRT